MSDVHKTSKDESLQYDRDYTVAELAALCRTKDREIERIKLRFAGACAELTGARSQIEDQHLSLQAASIFIREVYEAVHCRPLVGDLANLTDLAQQVIGEIERWKVAASPAETNREPTESERLLLKIDWVSDFEDVRPPGDFDKVLDEVAAYVHAHKLSARCPSKAEAPRETRAPLSAEAQCGDKINLNGVDWICTLPANHRDHDRHPHCVHGIPTNSPSACPSCHSQLKTISPQERALDELAAQAQRLDMGYGPTASAPSDTSSRTPAELPSPGSSSEGADPICPTCKTFLAFEGDVCGLCNPVAQP